MIEAQAAQGLTPRGGLPFTDFRLPNSNFPFLTSIFLFFCSWFFFYFLFSNEYLSSHHKTMCLFIVSSVFFRPVPSKSLKNEKSKVLNLLKAGRRDLTVGGRKSVVPPQVVVLLIPFQKAVVSPGRTLRSDRPGETTARRVMNITRRKYNFQTSKVYLTRSKTPFHCRCQIQLNCILAGTTNET